MDQAQPKLIPCLRQAHILLGSSLDQNFSALVAEPVSSTLVLLLLIPVQVQFNCKLYSSASQLQTSSTNASRFTVLGAIGTVVQNAEPVQYISALDADTNLMQVRAQLNQSQSRLQLALLMLIPMQVQVNCKLYLMLSSNASQLQTLSTNASGFAVLGVTGTVVQNAEPVQYVSALDADTKLMQMRAQLNQSQSRIQLVLLMLIPMQVQCKCKVLLKALMPTQSTNASGFTFLGLLGTDVQN